jgi:hypothetical protein
MRVRRGAGSALLIALTLGPGNAAPAQELTVQERLGHSPDARLLLIHADDLGMARSVNRATFEALEKGYVTSASILVPCPWFPEVAQWAREHEDADLGIHLALNSEWTTYRWGPVASSDAVASLLDEDGFLPLGQAPIVESGNPAQVELELRAQIERALQEGIRITHLDAHMGTVVMTEELSQIYRRLGAEYGVPLRLQRRGRPAGVPEALVDETVGIPLGVPLSRWQEAYEELLAPLPPGVYELIVHLAYADEEMRAATRDHPDWGAEWRQADFDMVSRASFREFLEREGFVLVTWRELAGAAVSR